MDTLSHGLWATALGKGINVTAKKRLRLGWMALWGIFPDLFSFIPVILWMLWQIFYGGVDFGEIPRPETLSPEQRSSYSIFRVTQYLYNSSHSLIIFFLCFLLILIFRLYSSTYKQRKAPSVYNPARSTAIMPCWEMSGWAIHILTDIPTHSRTFYPTLFLWPLSDWCYDGVSWGNMRFMIINYTSLLMVFVFLRLVQRLKSKHDSRKNRDKK